MSISNTLKNAANALTFGAAFRGNREQSFSTIVPDRSLSHEATVFKSNYLKSKLIASKAKIGAIATGVVCTLGVAAVIAGAIASAPIVIAMGAVTAVSYGIYTGVAIVTNVVARRSMASNDEAFQGETGVRVDGGEGLRVVHVRPRQRGQAYVQGAEATGVGSLGNTNRNTGERLPHSQDDEEQGKADCPNPTTTRPTVFDLPGSPTRLGRG